MKILVAFRETSHIDLAHGNVIRTLRGGGGGRMMKGVLLGCLFVNGR